MASWARRFSTKAISGSLACVSFLLSFPQVHVLPEPFLAQGSALPSPWLEQVDELGQTVVACPSSVFFPESQFGQPSPVAKILAS